MNIPGHNELVNMLHRKRKTVDGKLKHEAFMEQYQLLLKHINSKRQPGSI
jgi:hypothetical protein